MSTPETFVHWRNSRWFKPVAGLSFLIMLVLLSALLIPRLIDLESSRGAIVAQIERQLDRRVTLGRLSLRLLPSIEVRAGAVTIADDPGFPAGDFITAKSVRLQVGLWSLLRGSPQLRGIELEEPTVRLIRTKREATARWNWESLKPLRETASTADAPALNLVVRGGRFTLIDQLAESLVESTLSGIDIRLDGFSPQRSFGYAVTLNMPESDGQKGGRLEFEGRMGPIVASELPRTPIEAQLKMERVELAALEALAGLPRSGQSGLLTLRLDLAGNLAQSLSAKGSLKAENLRLVEGVAPSRSPFEASFDIAISVLTGSKGAGELDLRIRQGELAIGQTRVSLNGHIGRVPIVPTAGSTPVIDLSITGQGVSLESLLESANAFGFGSALSGSASGAPIGAGGAAGAKAAGSADITLRVQSDGSTVGLPAFDGQVLIRGLRFESATLPQAVEVSQLTIVSTPQAITVAPFRTSLGSGSALEISRLVLSDYRQEPRLQLDAGTRDARIEDLLKMAEFFQGRQGRGVSPDLTGSGRITLNASIEAKLPPAPASPVLISLRGGGKITGATLRAGELTRPIQVSNADLTFSGDSARFDNIAATLDSAALSGWIAIRDLNKPGPSALNFDLRANKLVASELESLNGAKASPSGNGPSLTADGQIAIGQLVLENMTLENVQARVALRNGVVTLDPLTLALCGGSYRGLVRLDQRAASPGLALKGRLSGVDVNQLLSAGGKKSMIYGRLDGSIDVSSRSAGNKATDLLDTLLGTGQIQISDGKLTSFDLMKQLETIGRLVNLPTGGAATAFRSLRTNLTFEQGRMRTDAVQMVMTDLSANGDGQLRFGEPGSMEYSILARLSPTLTKRVLSGVGGQSLSTTSDDPRSGSLGRVLGSFFVEKDSLVIPLKISGPLTGPTFGLDTVILRQRATKSFMDNLLQKIPGQQKIPGPNDPNGQKGNEGATGDQTRPEPGVTPQKKQPTAEDAIRGIFDRLKKKKPED
jgi:uncharacterized protein involved in outer membrane biogenesis